MAISKTAGLGALAALLGTTGLAAAQRAPDTFGARGQFAISGERLLGVYVVNSEVEQTGTATGGGGPELSLAVNSESDTTSIAFLGNDGGLGPAGIPRLALDYFVIDGLSIGGSLLISTDSSDADDLSTASTDGGIDFQAHERREVSATLFSLAPRVGYAHMFTPVVGIWARGGITYLSANVETTTEDIDDDGSVDDTEDREDSISHWSLSLEGLLVLSPIPHVAFGVGPFVDIPLAGSFETEISNPPNQQQLDGDISVTSFGVTTALIVWF